MTRESLRARLTLAKKENAWRSEPGATGNKATIRCLDSTKFCTCRSNVACICCLRWNRLIRRLEARRAAWGAA